MLNMSGAANDPLLEKYAPTLKNLIRFSSALNAKDILFYKSIDPSIRDDAEGVNSELVDSMNDLLMSAQTISTDSNLSNLKFQNDFEKENNQLISNILDTLLERVEINLDNHYKAKNRKVTINKTTVENPIDDGYTYLDKADAEHANSSNQYNQSRLLPMKSNPNMEKPQAKFLEKINNFETSPFQPLIKFKPNAVRSLEDSLQLVEATEETPKHYENPYSYEIMNSEYPEWILNTVPEEQRFKSIPWDGSPAAQWIDTPEQLDSLLLELTKCKVIAIDLEHHDYRTYHGLTSLMQITTDSRKDYLIDPLSPTLRPHLTILNEVFTNSSIVKVLHGAFMDVIWLQRDLGLYLVSLFDTFHASKQLSLGKYSLAYLLEEYVKFRTSKKWQLADWRIRPLSNEMMDYAKADTHFLIEVFYKMHEDLLKIPNALQKTLYSSRKVALRRFEYPTFRPKNLSMSSNSEVVTTSGAVPLLDEIINKVTCNYDRDLPWTNLIFNNNLPLERRPLLEIMFKWRDHEAREKDESSRFIMSDFMLVSLVNNFEIGNPDKVTVQSVMAVIEKCSKFGGSYYARKVIKEITNVIKDAVTELKDIDLNKLLVANNKEDSDSDVTGRFSNDNDVESIDVYESVKDVNKLHEKFGHFIQFYNDHIHSKVSENNLVEETHETGLNNAFAVGYNKKGKANIVENRKVNDRINEVVEYFKETMGKPVEFEVEEEEEEEEESVDVEDGHFERENSDENEQKNVIPARDEIITLRKRNSTNHTKKRKATDESIDDSVDFTKSIMEKDEDDGNSRRGRRDKKPRKAPSFDPYSRDLLSDMNIPQLKKKKMVDRGKNVVFRKK